MPTEIPDEITKIILEAKHEISTKINEDETIETTMKIGDLERTIKYKLGEEFEQELLTGEKVKSKIKIEGDKFIEEQLDGKAAGKTVTIEKCGPECATDGLKVTIAFGGATGTGCYKKTAWTAAIAMEMDKAVYSFPLFFLLFFLPFIHDKRGEGRGLKL